MQLYFGTRDNHKEEFIIESDSLKIIREEMDDYLKKVHYTSFYKTSGAMPGDKCVEIDFGSHTNFFYIYDITWKEYLYKLERVK